jgi:predicted DNA-binding transcriptional regulator YafY
VLEAGLDLPPLMLTQDEIEAAVLGAQWVARHSDPILARAAEDLIAKIGAVVPERLRPYVLEPATDTPPVRDLAADGLDRHGCAPRSMRAGRSRYATATSRAVKPDARSGQ